MRARKMGQFLFTGIAFGMLIIPSFPGVVLGGTNDYIAKLSGRVSGLCNMAVNVKDDANAYLSGGLQNTKAKLQGVLSSLSPKRYLANKRNFYTANNTIDGLNNSEYSAQQKAMPFNLTAEECCGLSKLGYADIMNATEFNTTYKNKQLFEIDQILDNNTKNIGYGTILNAEHRENIDQLAHNPKTANLTLIDYVDQNGQGGLVAYAFAVPGSQNGTLFSFRGSEGSKEGNGQGGFLQLLDELTSEDWIDNFHTYFSSKSDQFTASKDFVLKNMKENGQIFVTGHSKGAANAAFVCAALNNSSGIAFNGMGIGQTLGSNQRERLKNSPFINVVTENDPVGSLAFHPEERVFGMPQPHYERYANGSFVYDTAGNGTKVLKEIKGPVADHYIQAFSFDEKGNVVLTQQRPESSLSLEKTTQILYLGHKALHEPLGKVVSGIDSLKKSLKSL